MVFSPKDGTPYVLAKEWLGKVVEGEVQLIRIFPDPAFFGDSDFCHLQFTIDNQLVFSNRSPAYICEDGKLRALKYDHIISTTICSGLLVDREGNIWIATARGVVKLNTDNFVNYNKLSGLQENEVSAIIQSPRLKNTILASNNSFSVLSQEGDITGQFISDYSNIVDTRILRVLENPDGSFHFVANNKGLGLWRKGQSIRWVKSPDPNSRLMTDGFYFKNDFYLITGRGIFRKKGHSTFEKVAEHHSNIRKAQMLSDGTVLLMGSEILQFHGDSLSVKYQLANKYAESIYGVCDWNGRLLVGTRQGLQEAKEGEIRPAKLRGQVINAAIYAMLHDSRGNLWVGTANGIYQVTPSQINYFNKSNGLIGNEINRNALIEGADGKIWIGTDEGVSIYSYSSGIYKSQKPIVQIKSIKANINRELIDLDNIELSPSENDLEFRFTGISFRNEKEVNYRYRLQGYNNEWEFINHNEHPSARYTNLPSGSYTFEVQARMANEEWSESALSPKVYIQQAFFRSPLFYIVLGLIAIGLGILIQTLITQQKTQSRLRQMVEEKIKQVRSSEDELKLKNQQLLSLNQELDQFVYSVSHDLKAPLSSIKGLIDIVALAQTTEEREPLFALMASSVDRLKDFIGDLEAVARNKRIAIERQEIDLKELICSSIETLRFSEEAKAVEIQHEIAQDSSKFISDPNRISVVLNNLLSNGVRYRKEYFNDSFVHIKAKVQEGNLTLTVEDNGIGIHPNRIHKVFEMFEKGDSQKKGSSGLGLFIVKETVSKLNGEVSVESQVNQGTTFTVKLPSLEEAPNNEG